jgi:hypothetical protein
MASFESGLSICLSLSHFLPLLCSQARLSCLKAETRWLGGKREPGITETSKEHKNMVMALGGCLLLMESWTHRYTGGWMNGWMGGFKR